MKQHFLLFFFFFSMLQCWAQQSDSLATTPLLDTILVLDSAEAKKGLFNFFTKDYPNPRKAALLALVLPGAGQIYNKRWWKVPFVYAAIGGTIYGISYNQSRYKRFKVAYTQKLADQPTEFVGLAIDNVRSLRLLRDRFDKNTQLSYVGLIAVYALQAVEAFVDSHLKTFDVNEDLSLQLKPSLQPNGLNHQPTLGVGVALQFKP